VPDVRPARISSGSRHALKVVLPAMCESAPGATACAIVMEGPAGGPNSASSSSGAAARLLVFRTGSAIAAASPAVTARREGNAFGGMLLAIVFPRTIGYD